MDKEGEMDKEDRGRVLHFRTNYDGRAFGIVYIREADLVGKSRSEARKFVGEWCQLLYEQFMARWATSGWTRPRRCGGACGRERNKKSDRDYWD